MKHTKENKHHQEGLRKSSSLHDLSTDERESGNLNDSRFLSRSGDRLDTDHRDAYSDTARILAGYGNNPYATLPRNHPFKPPTGKSLQSSSQNSASNSSVASAPSQLSTSDTGLTQRRGSFDDKTIQKSRNASERARLHRERSASMKSFPTVLTLPKIPSSVGSASVDRLLPSSSRAESSGHGQADGGAHQNETDEHKVRHFLFDNVQYCTWHCIPLVKMVLNQ